MLHALIQGQRCSNCPLTHVSEQDAGVVQDCVQLVRSAIEKLNGLDIIISNAVSYFDRSPNGYLTAKGLDKIYQLW